MSTTLIFAELLIIGLQATVWLALAVVATSGLRWADLAAVSIGSGWQPVILAVALAFVYSIGILVDRIADLVFWPWDRSLKAKYIPESPDPVLVLRAEIGDENKALSEHLQYTRSRMRIVRASALNFALITLLACVVVRPLEAPRWAALIVFFGSGLVAASVYAWTNLTKTYLLMVKASYLRRGRPVS